MKRMKGNHLKVIEKIQDQYKAIEEHTQVNTKMFFIILPKSSRIMQLSPKMNFYYGGLSTNNLHFVVGVMAVLLIFLAKLF